MIALDRLHDALRRPSLVVLSEALVAYEATGDHDHGDDRGSLLPGALCPGGDCLVAAARQRLSAGKGVRA